MSTIDVHRCNCCTKTVDKIPKEPDWITIESVRDGMVISRTLSREETIVNKYRIFQASIQKSFVCEALNDNLDFCNITCFVMYFISVLHLNIKATFTNTEEKS